MVTVQNIKNALRWTVDSYVVFVVIGVVIGLTFAPAAMHVTASPDGKIAVVPLDGTIDGRQATAVSGMLQEARQDPDVEAVVIVANSGGGSAVASEELYMQTKRTAEEMPVITIVEGGALSGAYHMIAPSDHVYVKPASVVGSVGVIAQLPPAVEPNNVIGTTGPNKLTGSDERAFLHRMETVQNSFVAAIYEHRGDRLELSRAELSHAQVYGGAEAVRNGLADDIGDRQTAMEHAAEEADLDSYQVGTLRSESDSARFVLRSTYLASDAPNKEMIDSNHFLEEDPAVPTFLMLPAGVFARDDTDRHLVGTRGDAVAPVNDVSQGQVRTTPGDGTETDEDTVTDDSTSDASVDGETNSTETNDAAAVVGSVPGHAPVSIGSIASREVSP